MNNLENVKSLRQAIASALPFETSNFGHPPKAGEVFIPMSHTKALKLEASLVVGARGVGKSFWCSALYDDSIRKLLSSYISGIESSKVFIGYCERPDINNFPDKATIASLLYQHAKPLHIWRGIILRFIANIVNLPVPTSKWIETINWVKNSPEQCAQGLEKLDGLLHNKNLHYLFLFDSLDRCSDDWHITDTLVSGLLQLALDFKSFRHIHVKVFLREDQFVERAVLNFPDASKLNATRVELTWFLHDLHGLLWQYLINASGDYGQTFRNIITDVAHEKIKESSKDVWILLMLLRRSEEAQRALFTQLAGKWMGRDHRRGVPYHWAVGHLADGRGRTSPRSFLAAIRAAAEDSSERYDDQPIPLHFESIKRGVQKASQIRVNELAEDYPWIRTYMSPLQGLTVPCVFPDIKSRWDESEAFKKNPSGTSGLPPEHLKDGPDGLRLDFESLGIFEMMRDKRVNIPDLYRVGFGLGRRGGVKPLMRE